MKIKGIVKQIITPKEIESGNYILYNEEVFEPGKYLIYIETEKFSQMGFFKKLISRYGFRSKTREEMNAWSIIFNFNEIKFKIGDLIEIEIEPVQIFSGYFEAKKDD